MAFWNFLMFFMTVLISSTVSRSGDHVFVQTGDSVTLDIKNKPLLNFRRLLWVKDQSENIIRCVNESGDLKFNNYKDRVDFNNKTLSVTLKNMQKTDSGLYTATAIGERTTSVAEHNVLVIDPVDSPVLKGNFTMISVNVCVVNVSCSGPDQTIRHSYHSNDCTQEEVTSSGVQTLALYCRKNRVVCNYSNPVSWKNQTIEINQLCTPYEKEHPEENNSPLFLWLSVIAGVFVLVFTAVSVFYCCYKKRKKGPQQNEQTVYAQVQPMNQVQRPLEMLEKSANLQTVYGFTGEHKQTHNASQMPSHQTQEQVQTEKRPSTTYSTVGQHQKPLFTSKPDPTIYSVVCKPKQDRQPMHK
ncbi:natural killer cell receptor 2B4-like [Puntigrus tetrazona]|uniref:natural killer cell receptor 2B4-like n=1 Tax=Puntigrus tetrazona TaxID=1606681 RepID=UPI001C8A2DA4|nr:natural killer cell receptor 2B4-like [Puntigrus tetrazona]